MSLSLKGVPATIVSCSFNAKNVRKVDDVGKQPARLKDVTLILDVTDERFMMELLKVFPGLDIATKAMGSAEKAGAATFRMEKKLAEVSIVVAGMDGEEVFKADVARPKGKPTVRASAGARKLEMPITVSAGVPRSAIQKIDDMIGADVRVNLSIVQATIDDVLDDGGAKPKKGKAAASKTTVTLVDDGAVN